MKSVAIGCRNQLPHHLVKSMHEFRHEVFVRRLGWPLQPVPCVEAGERDEYDTADTLYLVVSDERERVTACARLLASTGPYMLRSLFPQLLGEMPPPSDPSIWELSRFATDVRATRQGRVLSLSASTLDLLDMVIEAARQRSVRKLILATSVAVERLMLRACIDSHRVAPPKRIDGALCVALLIDVPAPKTVVDALNRTALRLVRTARDERPYPLDDPAVIRSGAP